MRGAASVKPARQWHRRRRAGRASSSQRFRRRGWPVVQSCAQTFRSFRVARRRRYRLVAAASRRTVRFKVEGWDRRGRREGGDPSGSSSAPAGLGDASAPSGDSAMPCRSPRARPEPRCRCSGSPPPLRRPPCQVAAAPRAPVRVRYRLNQNVGGQSYVRSAEVEDDDRPPGMGAIDGWNARSRAAVASQNRRRGEQHPQSRCSATAVRCPRPKHVEAPADGDVRSAPCRSSKRRSRGVRLFVPTSCRERGQLEGSDRSAQARKEAPRTRSPSSVTPSVSAAATTACSTVR